MTEDHEAGQHTAQPGHRAPAALRKPAAARRSMSGPKLPCAVRRSMQQGRRPPRSTPASNHPSHL
jgi:hypothetical protein